MSDINKKAHTVTPFKPEIHNPSVGDTYGSRKKFLEVSPPSTQITPPQRQGVDPTQLPNPQRHLIDQFNTAKQPDTIQFDPKATYKKTQRRLFAADTPLKPNRLHYFETGIKGGRFPDPVLIDYLTSVIKAGQPTSPNQIAKKRTA